jgi:hypothetical protein
VLHGGEWLASAIRKKEIAMHATVQKTCSPDARHIPDDVTPRTNPNTATDTVHLGRTQHLTLHNRAGWTVRALCGTAWITQDGDLRDIVLEAGDAFMLDRNGSALVSALNETRVSITRGTNRPAQQKRAEPAPLPARGGVRAALA